MTATALKNEATAQLAAILSYWARYAIDNKQGGFAGKIDNNNTVDETAEKGSVLNARILWTFSAAAIINPDPASAAIAKRAYEYITANFIDEQYGGVYWTLSYDGKPAQIKKQVYAQAFMVYACSEYYKLSKDTGALSLAISLYRLLEEHSYDKKNGGYLEAFTRDWQLAADLRLSDKDANEKKTMNTHLHVLEAYANLYKVWPDEMLKDRIGSLLDIFQNRMIDTQTAHLRLFFTDNWDIRPAAVSYGHDIEASWLLLEAAEIIGDQEHIDRFKTIAVQMANATIKGIDTDGGLWYEYEPASKKTIKEKHWWVQAEAMVGFFSAWQLSGDQQYFEIVINTWTFIKQRIIDQENGEWFWGVKEDYTLMQEDKAGLWKCPYHNGRACMEIIKRIRE